MANIKYYVCKCTECGKVYPPYLVRCPNCNSYSAIKLPNKGNNAEFIR